MARNKNTRLKKAYSQTEYSPELIQELARCITDPIYFIEKYVYIKGIKGKSLFKLYDYQKEMINAYMTGNRVIILASRQVGKTETSAAFILWFTIFHAEKLVLIASNKSENAKEIIGKIIFAYEELPDWIKPGIDDATWNKFSLAFENRSRVLAATTSEDTGRGLAIDLLYVDELAFVKKHIQDAFFASILPTLASRAQGKMIISSTPNGDIDIFAETWRGAVAELNGFKHVFVPWNAPPGRDEAFKLARIKEFGGNDRKWLQEFECKFLSSDYTLIDTQHINNIEELNRMEDVKFEFSVGDQGFWKRIHKRNSYIVGVDVAEGMGQDFSVIEVYEFPSLIQVMELRTNQLLAPQLYKTLKNILIYLQHYGGDIYFSIENNGLGLGIIALYQADENPPEAMFVSEKGKEKGVEKLGFNTNSKSKPRTCLLLREMVVRNQIRIHSQILLNELKSFVSKAGTFQAATGATDDCISATLIVLRIIEVIASHDENAFQKLYISGLEEIEKDTQGNFIIDDWSKEKFTEIEYDDPLPFIFL